MRQTAGHMDLNTMGRFSTKSDTDVIYRGETMCLFVSFESPNRKESLLNYSWSCVAAALTDSCQVRLAITVYDFHNLQSM